MKASVFIAATVDGFIARPNGAFDFLPTGDVEEHGYEAFMASVDALIMGRNTYEVAASFDGWPYGDKPVFVVSSRPLPPVPAGAVVERVSGTPAEIVASLSARGVEHAYVDGGMTIQSFLSAGLIQRLIITRVPVLIGVGISLFGPVPHDVVLIHVATRQFPSGLVQSEYAIRG